MMQKLWLLTENRVEVLRFLKAKYYFIHLSNVFFRDFQYGLMAYFESRGTKLAYGEAEQLAKEFVKSLEQADVLRPIRPGSWMLNFPEFTKPPVKPAAPAKPAAAAAPRAATGSAPRQSAASAAASSPVGDDSSRAAASGENKP